MSTRLFTLSFASLILCLVLVSGGTSAQDPARDSKEVEVPITEVSFGCRPVWNDPLIINDQEALRKALDKEDTNYCKLDRSVKIDFHKYTLILLTEWADCNAMVSVGVTKNTEKKTYVVSLSEKYGGCRGMSGHTVTFLIEKLPTDYSVEFKASRLGRIGG